MFAAWHHAPCKEGSPGWRPAQDSLPIAARMTTRVVPRDATRLGRRQKSSGIADTRLPNLTLPRYLRNSLGQLLSRQRSSPCEDSMTWRLAQVVGSPHRTLTDGVLM